jgi:hypothetical protein
MVSCVRYIRYPRHFISPDAVYPGIIEFFRVPR